MRKWVLLIICFVFLQSTFLFAQDESENASTILKNPDDPLSDPPEKIHPVSIRVSAGVPNSASSQLFRKCMIGIYEANISGHYRLGNYFHIGLGATNTLMSVSNRTKFNAHTKLQMYGAYFSAGYDMYHHAKMFSSFYLNTGYSKGFYTGVLNLETKPHNLAVEMVFIQPNYSINFFAEERMTLGFYFGYHYMLWNFNPDQINLVDTGLDPVKYKNRGNASYWLIGLEMYIGLGKR